MSVNPAATERLTLSRARLRQAMVEIAMPPSQAAGACADSSGSGWRATLMQNPGTRLLLELGLAWWARQPLGLVMPLIAQVAQVTLAPSAQRHPVRLVLGAAAAGAALVLVRPWRWLSATALLARLLPPPLSEIARRTPALSSALPAAAAKRGAAP
ncbi:MAG: hypothetical protein JZU64_10720 [Rhodoferax sp.]|nr:hypothetical protein [Rhodoferax sp.]